MSVEDRVKKALERAEGTLEKTLGTLPDRLADLPGRIEQALKGDASPGSRRQRIDELLARQAAAIDEKRERAAAAERGREGFEAAWERTQHAVLRPVMEEYGAKLAAHGNAFAIDFGAPEESRIALQIAFRSAAVPKPDTPRSGPLETGVELSCSMAEPKVIRARATYGGADTDALHQTFRHPDEITPEVADELVARGIAVLLEESIKRG
jgi:hypothetical protein